MTDKRALVLEDEFLVAMLIEDMLRDAGYEAIDMVANLDDALSAAQANAYEVAILDVNVVGRPSYPVADVLRARDIPFLFSTGYGPAGLHADYASVPALQKPFQQADFERVLNAVLRRDP